MNKSTLFESLGDILRPTIEAETLETWHCQICGAECAGKSLYKLCKTCEEIKAHHDQRAEDIAEFYHQDNDERIMHHIEAEREYYNSLGI